MWAWGGVGDGVVVLPHPRPSGEDSELRRESRSDCPLKLESPTGQHLSQILQTHPHLFPAAIDQQLRQLQSDENLLKEKTSPAPQDVLYRRIAEVKNKERHRAVEEIIYCLVVQKFARKLEAVHSQDALEMIESHIALVLGERSVGPLNSVAQISKIKLGSSTPPPLCTATSSRGPSPAARRPAHHLRQSQGQPLWDVESLIQIPADEDDDGDEFGGGGRDSSRLRSYVMYLDAETLQRYATMRSKAAISLIEKQTQALFGRPDIRLADDGSIELPNDEVVSITFSGLTTLVLEAVAFGSFLWDAESFVESRYHFLST
ncbi:unnamed protein product [Spirodela intermedia]|uniref:Uncharacterized protein n=1 Tax=Spirodela intermedia TaxID=51605 RepID=A0A7I8JI77_SPIIN|nr:unnamed protein product [Spirodela intermedia]CAA6669621.1 unnamed protein product [Spirodela intermedia]